MTGFSFTVLGRSQPAGSKRAFAIRKGGVPTGRVAVVDANPIQKSWQERVATAARHALELHGGQSDRLLIGPLRLSVTFVLARPKSHYGTGRNAEVVKPSAPHYPATKPDATKLLRAVEDALTGVLWRDDAQVVQQEVHKFYGAPERCEIRVVPLIATVGDVAALHEFDLAEETVA